MTFDLYIWDDGFVLLAKNLPLQEMRRRFKEESCELEEDNSLIVFDAETGEDVTDKFWDIYDQSGEDDEDWRDEEYWEIRTGIESDLESYKGKELINKLVDRVYGAMDKVLREQLKERGIL